MWTDDDRLEHLCRMALLAVAFLHWIIFILMVTSLDAPLSDQVPRALSNFASLLSNNLPRSERAASPARISHAGTP